MPTPRSSYRFDPDLKRRMKARADAEGISETEFVTRAIEIALKSDRPVHVAPTSVTLPREFRGPFPKKG